MRISILMPLALVLSSSAIAAPSLENSLQALMDKACQAGACVEAYQVKFRQIRYEASREQSTLMVSLLPDQGIDYPIIDETFEAQLTQTSFSAICRVKDVKRETFDALSRNEENEGTAVYRESLKSCLRSLATRTERALGRG